MECVSGKSKQNHPPNAIPDWFTRAVRLGHPVGSGPCCGVRGWPVCWHGRGLHAHSRCPHSLRSCFRTEWSQDVLPHPLPPKPWSPCAHSLSLGNQIEVLMGRTRNERGSLVLLLSLTVLNFYLLCVCVCCSLQPWSQCVCGLPLQAGNLFIPT